MKCRLATVCYELSTANPGGDVSSATMARMTGEEGIGAGFGGCEIAVVMKEQAWKIRCSTLAGSVRRLWLAPHRELAGSSIDDTCAIFVLYTHSVNLIHNGFTSVSNAVRTGREAAAPSPTTAPPAYFLRPQSPSTQLSRACSSELH